MLIQDCSILKLSHSVQKEEKCTFLRQRNCNNLWRQLFPIVVPLKQREEKLRRRTESMKYVFPTHTTSASHKQSAGEPEWPVLECKIVSGSLLPRFFCVLASGESVLVHISATKKKSERSSQEFHDAQSADRDLNWISRLWGSDYIRIVISSTSLASFN